jgi:hypothetical protein
MFAVNNQHHREGNESTPDASVDPRSALNQFLQAHIEPLQGIIRSYVIRTGWLTGKMFIRSQPMFSMRPSSRR